MSDPPSQNHEMNQRNANAEFKKEKIGHRRVNDRGTVTYKKKTTSDIRNAIQLGVNLSVGAVNNKPKRDLLLKDFGVEEVVSIPKCGTATTPAHQLNDFNFRTYAPLAFRRFREIFCVDMSGFMNSICSKELKELSNPGASGSIFYITQDDEFIIKTVQKKEVKFLQKLLPEYFMNLMQHPRTLLPKYFGLYSYETMGKNIRFVIMNNLLPSIKLDEKYDLKGSTFKRFASSKEKSKATPTLKDLDFKDKHPQGITLAPETYDALMNTIQRDCTVLESFRIMDYSLLLGVINVDRYRTENRISLSLEGSGADIFSASPFSDDSQAKDIQANLDGALAIGAPGDENKEVLVNRSGSHARSIKKLAAFSSPIEAIKQEGSTSDPTTEDRDYDELPPGGIPARTANGEKLYLYCGIIDILQSYQINKKLEHSWKSIIHDGEKISVTRPSFYKCRFEDMFFNVVFKKLPALRPKRKLSRLPETENSLTNQHQRSKSEVHYSEPDAGSFVSNAIGVGSMVDTVSARQTTHL